jgi:hypothetical protein
LSCWKQVIAPVCAASVCRRSPVSGSHIRSVESAAADTNDDDDERPRRPTREV